MATARRIKRPIPLKLRSSWPPDDLGPRESPRAINVRMHFGEVRPGPGRHILSGVQGDEMVLGLFKATFSDGAKWAIKLEETKLYRWGGASPASPREWHQIPGPGFVDSTFRWSGVTAEDRFFFVRGNEKIMRWPAGSGSPATSPYETIPASAGSVPITKFMEYVNDRLIAGYVTEGATVFAQRVRWSASGDHTDWDDTSGTGAGFLDLFEEGSEEITMLRALGSDCAVYHPSYISHLVPTGQAASAFREEGRVRGIGTKAGYTVASNGHVHFFLGVGGQVLTWDGIQIEDIGKDIEEEIKALLDPDDMDEYFGYCTPSTNEYWLVIGTNVFIYDYVLRTWARDTYGSLTALMEFEDIQSITSWASAPGTWENMGGTWSSYAATGAIRIWGGRANGAVQLIDETIVHDYWSQGSIVDRLVESDDMYIGFDQFGNPDPMHNSIIKRMFCVYKYVNSAPFEVGVSLDQGTTWKTFTVNPHRRGFSFIDPGDMIPASNIARYRLRENNAEGRFRWRSMILEIEDAGDFNPAQLDV